MIPKIIHYFWSGKNLPHPTFIEDWKKLHPGWIIYCWNETNILSDCDYVKNAVSSKNWAKVSDWLRLWALKEFGGIYLDTDVELLKPLDELLKNKAFLGFQSSDPTRLLNSAVLGSEINGYLASNLLSKLTKDFTGFERDDSTGPGIITQFICSNFCEKIENIKNVNENIETVLCTIYAKNVFYPMDWPKMGVKSERVFYPETIGIHHWDVSWWKRPLGEVFNPFN